MGVWPQDAPDKVETVSLRYEKGVCVELNGKRLAPVEMMLEANAVAGRNGIGIANALENRIIGTKSRGVYEAPGMELLGRGLESIYQAVLDRRAALLFRDLSKLVADSIYDGRIFDPAPRAALAAIDLMAGRASGRVEFGLYKGNIFFQQMTDCAGSLYNQADASMEASEGLNPTSSQGYVEIQRVEAVALARAGQIVAPSW
jgi:argininosuccinate synthase